MTLQGPQSSNPTVAHLDVGMRFLTSWMARFLIIALGLIATGWLLGRIWTLVFPVLLAVLLTTVLLPPTRLLLLTLVLPFFFCKDGQRFLPWVRHWTGETAARHVQTLGSRIWRGAGGSAG